MPLPTWLGVDVGIERLVGDHDFAVARGCDGLRERADLERAVLEHHDA